MKYLILLMTLFFSLEASAAIGTITALKGSATIDRHQLIMPVKIGSTIDTTDIIQTSDKTLLQIIFSDKTAVTLGANTQFSVQSYQFGNAENSNAEFSLTKGFFKSISGKIGKLAPQRFKVKTPTATIGIRGTTYSIQANPDKTILKTFKGETYLVDNVSGISYSVVQNKQLVYNHISKEAKISTLKASEVVITSQAATESESTEDSGETTETTEDSGETTEATEDSGETTEATEDSGETTEATEDSGETTEATEDSGETTEATEDSGETTEATEDSGETTEATEDSGETTDTTDIVEETDDVTTDADDAATEDDTSTEVTSTKVTEGEASYTSFGYWLNGTTGEITGVWADGSPITEAGIIDSAIGTSATAKYNGDLVAFDENNIGGTGSIKIDVDFDGGGTAVDGDLNYTVGDTHWKTNFVGSVNNTGMTINNFIANPGSDVNGINGQLNGQFYGSKAEDMAGTFNLTGTVDKTGLSTTSTGAFSATGNGIK